jgi:asparagine synthetase B (glutamine-hydrolysing)
MIAEINNSLRMPFFHARKEPDRVYTKGDAQCFSGHKIKGQGHDGDGIYTEWSWDGNRLIVRNDRYGFYPLFYSMQENDICVSNSIFRLLEEGVSPEIDPTAMAVFLRLGYFIGEDTPFRSIRALPPDATLEWKDGHLAVSGRYAIRKPQYMERDAAVDHYVSLFRESIRRRIPPGDDFAVPLSGGRDSRHILLELCGLGYRPKLCATVRRFPPVTGDDVRIASQLAHAVKSDHVVIEQKASRFQAELRKNIVTNFCADEHAWLLAVADDLNGKVRTVYDGIGGDVLSESGYLNKERLDQFDSGSFEALARSFFVYDEESVKQLVHHENRSIIDDEIAIHHLIKELKKHENAPNPVTSFVFWNRTRREIALSPYGIFRQVPTVFSPYLDHEVYDFLSSLPPGMQLDRQFHSDAIRRAFPQYANIPFEEKNAPAAESRKQYIQFRKDFALCVVANKPSSLFRRSSLMPDLLGPLVRRRLSPLVLYLFQLELAREMTLARAERHGIHRTGGRGDL